MRKKECIAMLLAGGQGSRLGLLTKSNAKPAISFGGKYRIIDFSLSNCVNSGIDTVGVLVQYRPMILNRYLGTGEAWDLDSSSGGVHVLPPYATQTGGSWYEGTADSIYHNIDFMDVYDPEYVLIISGDHLYKMDYNLMLQYHKANEADLTISVIEVPWEEASRFGIMSADETGRVTKFQEKPENPESNLASMGIYIFSKEVLRRALIADHGDPQSSKDFGKDIIPRLLNDEKRVFAYKFEGYWKDVGTIQSYYDAHMDLLKDEPEFDIFDDDWKIYSNSNFYPPHMIGTEGDVTDSLVCNGCAINGMIEHSVIGMGVTVDEGAFVKDSVLLPDCHIKSGCRIERAVVDEGSEVAEGTNVGGSEGEIQVI